MKQDVALPIIRLPNYRILLSAIRNKRGYGSLRELADHIGCSEDTLGRISNGKLQNPKANIAKSLEAIAISEFGEERATKIWTQSQDTAGMQELTGIY